MAKHGGVLDLNANSIGVPSLSGSAGVITDSYGSGSGTTTLTVNQAGSTTFGGALVDGPHNLLALTVSVNGMLTLCRYQHLHRWDDAGAPAPCRPAATRPSAAPIARWPSTAVSWTSAATR